MQSGSTPVMLAVQGHVVAFFRSFWQRNRCLPRLTNHWIKQIRIINVSMIEMIEKRSDREEFNFPFQHTGNEWDGEQAEAE